MKRPSSSNLDEPLEKRNKPNLTDVKIVYDSKYSCKNEKLHAIKKDMDDAHSRGDLILAHTLRVYYEMLHEEIINNPLNPANLFM